MKKINQNGHINEEGIALYTEALKLNKVEQLPDDLRLHIQNCDDCHRQALDLYTLIAEADYSQLGKHPSLETAKPSRSKRYVRLSYGALAIAASICALLYFNTRENLNPSQVPGNQQAEVIEDTIPETKAPELPTAEIEKPKNNKPEKAPVPVPENTEQLAMNYEISDNLEDLVGEFTRSDIIKVDNPSPEATFKVGQFISFAWQGQGQEVLQLIILNNQEEELLNTKVENNSYQYEINLTKGLYYWKLESEDDLLYVGKFFIR